MVFHEKLYSPHGRSYYFSTIPIKYFHQFLLFHSWSPTKLLCPLPRNEALLLFFIFLIGMRHYYSKGKDKPAVMHCLKRKPLRNYRNGKCDLLVDLTQNKGCEIVNKSHPIFLYLSSQPRSFSLTHTHTHTEKEQYSFLC